MRTIVVPPTQNFKKAAFDATVSILTFIVVYIALLLGALALTIMLGGAGLSLIFLLIPRMHLFGAFLGLALISIGVVVLVFLIKFIFTRNKTNLQGYTEITRSQHPELFGLLDEIVEQVGTSYPKKVYLTSDVNAAVFYDSSFLSMFLPIRKNLNIGIGLMNSLTQDELKAVLAHEFGHFSQKSMKIGSYVYHSNQVIYNLLYQNDTFAASIRELSNIHWSLNLGVRIAIFIILGIQRILQFFYKFININHLKLSREMEFHADAIAAHVAGSDALSTALLRIDLAHSAYDTVLNYYEKNIATGQITDDIYPQQTWMMQSIATQNQVPIVHKLPQITLEKYAKISQSKLVIEDQWATHPSMTERVQHLNQLGIPKKNAHQDLAINLLQYPENVSQQQTALLFAMVQYNRPVEKISYQQFVDNMQEEKTNNNYASAYKGYYDWRHPAVLEESLIQIEIISASLFSEAIFEKLEESTILNNDLQKLQLLVAQSELPEFIEYDHQRIPKPEFGSLFEKVKNALEANVEELFDHEQSVSIYCYQQACLQNKGEEYRTHLSLLTDTQQLHEQNYELVQRLYSSLQFIQINTPYKEIGEHFSRFTPIEKEFKTALNSLLADERWTPYWEAADRSACQTYLEGVFVYFSKPEYDNKALNSLWTAILIFEKMEWKVFFEEKQKFLHEQLPWLKDILKTE